MADIGSDWRTNEAWRDDFVFWARRELSKTGDLGAHAEVLRELAEALRPDEILWLYAELQKSYRVTCEWQAEFLALFPEIAASELPPPIFDEEAAVRKSDEMRAKSEQELAEWVRLHGRLPGPDDPIPF